MEQLARAYVAIRLPAQFQEAVNKVMMDVRSRAGSERLRWTPFQELHYAVAALGEVSNHRLLEIGEKISPIFKNYVPMRLCVEGLGGSPTVLQPRYIFLNLTGDDLGMLKQLHEEVERAVKPLCPDHETRPFEPIVPLARLKMQEERDRTALGRAVKMAAVGTLGEFVADRVEFLRNSITSSGPVLMTEKTYMLGQ